jgi:hypothetical protein
VPKEKGGEEEEEEEEEAVSYSMGTGGSFSGVKRPGRETDCSPPSSAEVKNDAAIFRLPQTQSRHVRDNFTSYLDMHRYN